MRVVVVVEGATGIDEGRLATRVAFKFRVIEAAAAARERDIYSVGQNRWHILLSLCRYRPCFHPSTTMNVSSADL